MARTKTKTSGEKRDEVRSIDATADPTSPGKPQRDRRHTAGKSRSKSDLTVVGVGASAGGLEALRLLLSGLPDQANLCYVIAQHLDPKHSSALVELLSRNTKMQVREIEDGQPAIANGIYITPPDRNAVIKRGKLYLSKPTTSFGPKPSVDMLFSSLAEDKAERAVGIILSGTGSDGAHGIRSIRGQGGITITQDPATAKYDGMPRAAIATQCVDLVLPSEEIGAELERVLKQAPLLPSVPKKKEDNKGLERILALLLEKTGCDFTDYKPATILRRIQRRMVTRKVVELADYVALLEKSHEEVQHLCRDVLISVTEFFRDPEVFEALRESFATIAKTKKTGDDFRIWVPGCASGEEAFTIGILLSEILGGRMKSLTLQIFATDIDEEALMRGRAALYPPAALENLPKDLVDRYFVHSDGGFRVAKQIRDLVIFAKHDLVKDPPFAHLDFISCRNVLIYFNSRLQDRVLSMFQYALNSDGYLLLGKSESVNRYRDLFRPTGKNVKIYKRVGSTDVALREFMNYQPPLGRKREAARDKRPEQKVPASNIMERAIVDAFGGTGVLINARQEIIYVQGDVRPYLGLREGAAGLDVCNMTLNPLRHELRALLSKSNREKTSLLSRPVRLGDDDESWYVTIKVCPVSSEGVSARTAIFFNDVGAVPPARDSSSSKGEEDVRMEVLERELNETRESLQTTVEELETANEELQSVNEELVSSNEEMQSSNEQLQTTNEELQSSNEELVTVNEELQVKSAELGNANADLENIQASIGLPLIVIDRHLVIKRFTKEAVSVLGVRPNDIGTPISAVPSRFHLDQLEKDLRTVIAGCEPVERTLEEQGQIMWARMFPYLQDGKALGAVLTFVDMTENRRIEQELLTLSSAVEHSPSSTLVTDADGRIEYVNPAFTRVSGYESNEVIGKNPRILKSGLMPRTTYEVLWKTITSGEVWRGELCNRGKKGALYWDLVAIAPLKNADGQITHFVGIQNDVTEQKNMEDQLRELQEHLLRVSRLSELGQMASALSHEINQPLAAAMNFANTCRRLLEKANDPKTEKAMSMAEKTVEQVGRAGDIVHRLHHFTEKRPPHRAIADINRVIEEATGLALIGTIGHGIESELKLAPGLPRVQIDAIQVQQVVMNLVRNSVDSMVSTEKKSLCIETKLTRDNLLVVCVCDTGSGLPNSVAEQVFEPFITTKPEGIGIGLSISQTIVQAHGGELWAKANASGGTTFYFTLPAAAVDMETGDRHG